MTVKVKFTQERIEDVVTVEEFIGALAGNFGAMVRIIGKMVTDESGEGYVSEEEGMKQIRSVTIKELKALTKNIAEELRNALVNPPSGGT